MIVSAIPPLNPWFRHSPARIAMGSVTGRTRLLSPDLGNDCPDVLRIFTLLVKELDHLGERDR